MPSVWLLPAPPGREGVPAVLLGCLCVGLALALKCGGVSRGAWLRAPRRGAVPGARNWSCRPGPGIGTGFLSVFEDAWVTSGTAVPVVSQCLAPGSGTG